MWLSKWVATLQFLPWLHSIVLSYFGSVSFSKRTSFRGSLINQVGGSMIAVYRTLNKAMDRGRKTNMGWVVVLICTLEEIFKGSLHVNKGLSIHKKKIFHHPHAITSITSIAITLPWQTLCILVSFFALRSSLPMLSSWKNGFRNCSSFSRL